MKKLVATAAILAFLGGGVWLLSKEVRLGSDTEAGAKLRTAINTSDGAKRGSEIKNDGGSSASKKIHQATFVPITGGPPRPIGAIDPFPNVPRSRAHEPLVGDPFIAQSVQEQQWLDRNGYPNAEQLAAYSTASDLALEQAAEHGDSVASVELAARQLAKGDPQASGKLMTAGANGSSYALSLLASYMAAGKYGNPELAYALSRVVEMRGDWRMPLTRDAMFPTPLTEQQRLQGEAEALRLFKQLAGKNGTQNFTDPRPMTN